MTTEQLNQITNKMQDKSKYIQQDQFQIRVDSNNESQFNEVRAEYKQEGGYLQQNEKNFRINESNPYIYHEDLKDDSKELNKEGVDLLEDEKYVQSLASNNNIQKKLLKPRLYSYRWVILILYLMSDFVPSVIVTTTTPIASQISQIYALHPIEVNLSSLIILIAAPIGTVLSSKFLDEKGLSTGLRIGTIICTGGAWLRILVNQSFYFVVAGNFLTGLGAPFIINGKTQIASNWFSHEQGPGVTSFISFWVNLNTIAGFVFSGNFLGDYRFDISQAKEGKNLVWELMILTALCVSGVTIIIWIFFKQNPETPPSFTAQIEREHDFKQSVKKLIRNRNYILLVLQQGLFLGSMSGLATSVSYFIQPFGFDSADSTLMLGAIPVGGVIGTIVGSYFLNKYKKYKLQMGIYSLGGAGSLCLFALMLHTEKIYLAIISTGVIGLFFIPMIPTLLEFACESVFPIGEGSTVGFLSGMSSLFALIYGGIMSFVVKGQSQTETYLGVIIMLSSFGLGFLLLFLTKENLIRDSVERLSQSQFENSVKKSDVYQKNTQSNDNSLTATCIYAENNIQTQDNTPETYKDVKYNNSQNIVSMQKNEKINFDIENTLHSNKNENKIRFSQISNPNEIIADYDSPTLLSPITSCDYSALDSEGKYQLNSENQKQNENGYQPPDYQIYYETQKVKYSKNKSDNQESHVKSTENTSQEEISDSEKIKSLVKNYYQKNKMNSSKKEMQKQNSNLISSESQSSTTKSNENEEERGSNQQNLLIDSDDLSKCLSGKEENDSENENYQENNTIIQQNNNIQEDSTEQSKSNESI